MKSRRPAVDWKSLHERLARIRSAEETATPAAGQVREILLARAARLAAPLAIAEAEGEQRTILVFRIGGERFGLELRDVCGVARNPRCSPVPGAPPTLAGVMQLRGEIRVVWNPARLLGLEGTPDEPPRLVVFVRHAEREYGLSVSEIEGVRTCRPEEMRPGRDGSAVAWLTCDLVQALDTGMLLKRGCE